MGTCQQETWKAFHPEIQSPYRLNSSLHYNPEPVGCPLIFISLKTSFKVFEIKKDLTSISTK
jgi:hypothetical protein